MQITKWKNVIWKGYMLYDSNYMTFWRRKNCGDNKKISGCQGLGGRRDELAEHRGLLAQWNYSVWYYYGDTCHYTFVQTHWMYNTKSETNVTYVLSVIIMC